MKLSPLAPVLFLTLTKGGHAMAQTELPEIQVSPVEEGLTKLWVADYVNVLLLRCQDETVLVDTGFEETSAQLAEKLEAMGVGRIEYVVNTHADRDHAGGNHILGAGSTIVSHENCRRSLAATDGYPAAGLPTLTFSDYLRIPCGLHEVVLVAMPGGHTDGDIIVHLPERKLVYLGDIVVPDTFPVVWLEYGEEVSVQRLSKILDAILQDFEEGTRFLSAHGPDYTMEDLAKYRDMVLATTELVRTAMESGKTLQDMQMERLLRDWESWNSRQFDWTNTDYWIDTVFRSLNQ